MARLTMVFGGLLMVLGIVFFCVTGSAHPTALIPTWFGVVLVLAGFLANTEDSKKRMLWMHIAVTVGLLGFVFPGARVVMAMVHGKSGPAVLEQELMALVCVVFTGLCVRSFVEARRTRAV